MTSTHSKLVGEEGVKQDGAASPSAPGVLQDEPSASELEAAHRQGYVRGLVDEGNRSAAIITDLLAACEEFVRKVDAGEARSKRSYAQMRAAIAKAKGA